MFILTSSTEDHMEAFLGVLGVLGTSMSGELRELRKGAVDSRARVSVVETMVDNIRDDTSEIKQDVKDTQEDVRTIDRNISDIKQMIMEQELRRMREVRNRPANPATRPPYDLQ